MAALVKLRCFASPTIEQATPVPGIATSTADNDGACARYQSRLGIEGRVTTDMRGTLEKEVRIRWGIPTRFSHCMTGEDAGFKLSKP
jgi:hypothetical protein